MNRFFIITSFLVLTFCGVKAQTEIVFNISETVIENRSQPVNEKLFENNDSIFYEDEKYLVRRTCSGEWGGSIWFKNKETGIEYSCAATCPVVVNKIDGKYIVTNSLAHLIGSTDIIEIENPDSLSIFQLPKPRKKRWGRKYYYVGDDEAKSTKGAKILVDSIGVLTIGSFLYKNELFHVVTDFKKTMLARIESNEFVTIDTISTEGIWTYNPEVIKTNDNHYLIYFSNSKVNGVLDIYENEIVLKKYK
jgi:hypothetical protein